MLHDDAAHICRACIIRANYRYDRYISEMTFQSCQGRALPYCYPRARLREWRDAWVSYLEGELRKILIKQREEN
jgi:hypothetical protein